MRITSIRKSSGPTRKLGNKINNKLKIKGKIRFVDLIDFIKKDLKGDQMGRDFCAFVLEISIN